ncbi:MAG: GGDEF domain-containing protein [Bacteroides sp.]|nr:GGDEF domain-containing protein [Bacteroides sp.]
MENERKYIAVLLSEVCEAYQSLLIDGIRKKAAECNCNVAIFASFFSKNMDNILGKKGENNIFNLVNYDLFDGFIALPNALPDDVLASMEEILQKLDKPVVYIDNENEKFYNVISDDYNSFKLITNHLIKKHGYTRINCITGFEGMNLSEARLKGYMDALRENGIEVEKDRYTYGDFWRVAPVQFVEHILSCGLELPQAIICANDTMAIATCDALKERGIRIPEEIAVTGYDRLIDSRVYHPQIASMEPALVEMGEKSVEIIFDLLNGRQVEKTQAVSGIFYPTESCGCPLDVQDKELDDINTLNKSIELSQYFINSIYMYEELQESADANMLFDLLPKFLYMIEGIKSMHVFLNDNWDVLNEQEMKGKDYNQGYSETSVNRFAYSFDETIGNLGSIKTSDVFPPLFDEKLAPDVYFFFPINFQNLTFGYSVCTCSKGTSVPGSVFRNWTKYLSNALEHIRSKEHLEWAIKRIERISEMDALTGVYNRLGYENRINKLFDRAKRENKDFLIINGDLDCLKKINDNFGHAEGDNAIRIIAKAFQNSFTEDEVCARIGGDEFIMFGCGDFDEEKKKNYFARIKEYLRHYNENSSKPYLIDVSLGIYSNRVSEDSTLKEWQDKADESMYEHKKGKVKNYLKNPQ